MVNNVGPWTKGENPFSGFKMENGEAWPIWAPGGEEVVALVYEEEDAAVVAAAPDMLAALQAVEEGWDNGLMGGVAEMVSAAIAKATWPAAISTDTEGGDGKL